MRTTSIKKQLRMMLNIRFDNEHGGKYAYMQFLACSRELVKLLKNEGGCEKQVDAIEGIRWLFNETLGAKFSHRHKVLFETKLFDLGEIFSELTMNNRRSLVRTHAHTMRHAQAA